MIEQYLSRTALVEGRKAHDKLSTFAPRSTPGPARWLRDYGKSDTGTDSGNVGKGREGGSNRQVRLATAATTRRASASVALARTKAPSRCGTNAPTATTTTAELGTRNIKVALRRLRKFAREGNQLELDLPDTIRSTAANAGWLDIKMVPERHNNVKVLLLMDGAAPWTSTSSAWKELFSAAKAEFKHLEFYYFHNCVYDFVWKNNRRRFAEKFDTWDIIRKYNKDYKLIFVGDATMSPYEILQPGGSVEYNNEEAGPNGCSA